MEVRKYQEDYFMPLFSFWNRLAEKVPYFFPVSPAKWRECLLEDKLEDETIFRFQETFIAIESGQVVGFTQYGQPAFAWDENGQRYNHPHIGVLRHFYFEPGRFDVANCLFAQSEHYLKQFPVQHAFYHIFGMSCNAHHGKLHQSLTHIDQFLCGNGYQVEHENVYYTLELNKRELIREMELRLVQSLSPEPDTDNFEICLLNNPIGTFQLRSLNSLTDGFTTDIAYLLWMELNKCFRGQGWGPKAMQLLVSYLRSKNYRELHLDTASTNKIAQSFYERFGFQNRGNTRSYLKMISP